MELRDAKTRCAIYAYILEAKNISIGNASEVLRMRRTGDQYVYRDGNQVNCHEILGSLLEGFGQEVAASNHLYLLLNDFSQESAAIDL